MVNATRTEWARGQLDILSVHSTVERSRKIAGAVSRPFSTMRTRQKLHQHRRLRTLELVPFFCVIRITEYHGTTGDNLFLFSCVWSESYLLFLPVVNDANFDFGAASLRYYRTHLTKRKKKKGAYYLLYFYWWWSRAVQLVRQVAQFCPVAPGATCSHITCAALQKSVASACPSSVD